MYKTFLQNASLEFVFVSFEQAKKILFRKFEKERVRIDLVLLCTLT